MENEGTPFVAAISDIDFFKCFNDNYGHACGYGVLKDVARHLRDGVGDKGFASRWAERDFCLYSPCRMPKRSKCLSIEDNICEYDDLKLSVTMMFGIS